MKEVNTQNYWSFELGTQEGSNVPIWIIVGFQQRDRQVSQNLNSDTFIGLQYQIFNAYMDQNAILITVY